MRGWMLWLGALSAVFLLQCGSEPETAARRAPSRAGSAGMNGAGEGGEGGVCVVCAGAAGSSGTAAEAGAVSGGSANAGSAGTGGAGGGSGAGNGGGGGVSGSSGSSGSVNDGGQAGGFIPEDAGVILAKLSAYQAVEVTLAPFDGRTRNAPIVVGRRLLVRAFLTPGPAFPGGAVTGRLTVNDGTTPPLELASSLLLDGPSEQADLETTLTFEVPAARVTEATTLSLVVENGDGELLRFPTSTPLALEAKDANGNLQVTLVPLVVNGFAPDLSEARVKSYTMLLRGMLPVPSVDVTVRMPYPLDYDVTADGEGWYEALDELYALRAADEPADNAYYYGVLAPGATIDDWCPDGCTVGLSVVAAAGEVEYRGSIGVGFFDTPRDTFSPETLVHELGHAMGREHSPCGTDDPDPRFPYADGYIGSWGLSNGTLRDPSVDADVMGYCAPVWVSDYTFARLFTRIAYVNQAARKLAPPPVSRTARERVRTLTLGADGTLRWGRERNGVVRSSASTTSVELLDAGGRVLSVVRAPFARLDHLPGGFVTLPASATATRGLASVRAFGRTLRFAQ